MEALTVNSEVAKISNSLASEVSGNVNSVIENRTLQRFVCYKLADLKEAGIKLARFAANRALNEKAIADKMKSLKKKGLLQAAVVVSAKVALKQNLEILDFETGNKINSENAEFYYVLLEGNHRYRAHLNLLEENNCKKNNEEMYKNEFFVTLPLQDSEKLGDDLMEMNISTRPWKGADFVSGAQMLVKEELPLLKALSQLTNEGYSLDAASGWLTMGKEITKSILTKAINGSIDEKLKNITHLENGESIRKAAEEKFGSAFIKTRTLPDWVTMRLKQAPEGDTKKETVERLIRFFESISNKEAIQLTETKGKRGGKNKESLIYEKLNEWYNNFYSEMSNKQVA